MGRWQPNAQGRLQQAAMELFAEHGYEQVTAAEIAQRADLTERTFFRYFADKREVLFAGGVQLEERMVAAVADAPDSVAPIDAIAAALDAAGIALGSHKEHSRLRKDLIVANPALQERELIKFASLASAMAGTLRERGVADPGASLTAEAGVAVLKVAFGRWLADDGSGDLLSFMRESLAELKAVTAGTFVLAPASVIAGVGKDGDRG